MTRDEILNMPAGSEMDGMMAKEVFNLPIKYYDVPGPILEASTNPAEPIKVWNQVPGYSADISAAWEVVEKMYVISLRRIVNPEKDDADSWWEAVIYEKDHVFAPTAPLAICRAALLAVMAP